MWSVVESVSFADKTHPCFALITIGIWTKSWREKRSWIFSYGFDRPHLCRSCRGVLGHRWCDVLVNSSRSAYAQGTSTDVVSAAGISNQARAVHTPSLSLLHAQLMLNVGPQDKLSVEPTPVAILSSYVQGAGSQSDLHSHSPYCFFHLVPSLAACSLTHSTWQHSSPSPAPDPA
jgi:hypothetical protein